ncbi:hypothetical protein [Rhizobium sp. BK376]|uniref:hypothetical protein n=1 Tax=Rhizobium sp. BK376 TaxID=2512149 RepID=UPI00105087A6|nr:hypothetical protein [Rhizobium sp. BK376]TCR76752.1 hypothetical protein EV561_11912 [Rhizobium sp. BK376]
MARGTGKSGAAVAAEHVDALLEYLETHGGRPLPRRGVDLNKTQIATECGFDRQVFRTNPRCAELLREADEQDRIAYLDRLAQAEMSREHKAAGDAKVHALEEKLLRCSAENQALKRRLAQLARVEALLAETGRLP